jgi:hypothetical protein
MVININLDTNEVNELINKYGIDAGKIVTLKIAEIFDVIYCKDVYINVEYVEPKIQSHTTVEYARNYHG